MLCSVLFCSGPRIMMHTYSCIRYREASEYYTQCKCLLTDWRMPAVYCTCLTVLEKDTSGTNPPPSQLGPTPLSVAIRTRLHRPKQCQEPSPRRNFTLRGSRGRGWARKEMSCVESLLCVSFSGPVCSPQFHFDSRDARMLLPTKEWMKWCTENRLSLYLSFSFFSPSLPFVSFFSGCRSFFFSCCLLV